MRAIIEKQSLADRVAHKIQEQVSLGHYKCNDKLPIEPDLMKMFGVGRSTIREAIKILANTGLLRVQQGAGTFVANTGSGKEPLHQRLKRADMHDLNEVRELLEIKIAQKAAANRTEKDMETMQGFLDQRKQYAEAGLVEQCIEADINFHVSIAEASKNEILADLYKSASIHLKNWFLNIYSDTKSFKQTHHLHQRLLQNIIDKDAPQAWSTAAEIIGHVDE